MSDTDCSELIIPSIIDGGTSGETISVDEASGTLGEEVELLSVDVATVVLAVTSISCVLVLVGVEVETLSVEEASSRFSSVVVARSIL